MKIGLFFVEKRLRKFIGNDMKSGIEILNHKNK